MRPSGPPVSRCAVGLVASSIVAPPSPAGVTGTPRRRWRPTGLQAATFMAMASASFWLGVAVAHVHEHYVRFGECERWRGNVTRWVQVVADSTGELQPVETTALTLAHGAMIAARDQACGLARSRQRLGDDERARRRSRRTSQWRGG